MENNENNNWGNAPQQSPYGNAPQQSQYGNAPQQSPYGNAPQQSPYGIQGKTTPPQKKSTGKLLVIGILAGTVGAVLLLAGFAIYGKKIIADMKAKNLTTEDYGHDDPFTEEPFTEEVTFTEEPFTDESLTEDGTDFTTEELTTEQFASEDPSVMPDDILNGTGEVVIKEFSDDTFKLNSWLEKHGNSYLVPNLDGTFIYYKEKDVVDNNYTIGHYDLYTGQKALDYITNNKDMEKYGVTLDEMMDVFARNDHYDLENFVCLVLHNEECYIDGENTLDEPVETPYFGFYMVGETEEALDIANMNTGTYYWFKME